MSLLYNSGMSQLCSLFPFSIGYGVWYWQAMILQDGQQQRCSVRSRFGSLSPPFYRAKLTFDCSPLARRLYCHIAWWNICYMVTQTDVLLCCLPPKPILHSSAYGTLWFLHVLGERDRPNVRSIACPILNFWLIWRFGTQVSRHWISNAIQYGNRNVRIMQ